jgi:hypothetical protein
METERGTSELRKSSRCAMIADKQAGKGRTMGDTKAIARAIRKQEATNCLNKPESGNMRS